MDIIIYLRDLNNEVVRAWSNEFRGYSNIKISKGNIFDIKADAIISPANSFGFMDGGIDLDYSYYFGWNLQKELQKKICKDYYGELPVGMATMVETNNEDIKFLISCPTMRVPEIIFNTANAYLAFRAALIEVLLFNDKNESQKIKSVLCPGLGTLTGGISPENCARQMRFAYDKIINAEPEFPANLSIACKNHNELMG